MVDHGFTMQRSDWHISIFLIIFGYVKNSQVTHRSCERIERIERGAIIETYFYEEFGMESF